MLQASSRGTTIAPPLLDDEVLLPLDDVPPPDDEVLLLEEEEPPDDEPPPPLPPQAATPNRLTTMARGRMGTAWLWVMNVEQRVETGGKINHADWHDVRSQITTRQ